MKVSNKYKLTIILSTVLLIASLTQDAYYLDDGQDSIGSFGLIAFLMGWVMYCDIRIIPWLANPLLLFSYYLIMKKKIKKAKLIGSIALLCGLSFLFYDKMPLNEAGFQGEITGYGIGYLLWLSSLIVNLIGIMVVDYFYSEN